MNGSLSFLQNLTQLQNLELNHTQVSGSITAIPHLTYLETFCVVSSLVSVPTAQELAAFTQQHPTCKFILNDH